MNGCMWLGVVAVVLSYALIWQQPNDWAARGAQGSSEVVGGERGF